MGIITYMTNTELSCELKEIPSDNVDLDRRVEERIQHLIDTKPEFKAAFLSLCGLETPSDQSGDSVPQD
jgi:hypothetical protein